MEIQVKPRGASRPPFKVVVPTEGATVQDLKTQIYKAKRKLYPSRQRLTLAGASPTEKPTVLQEGKLLSKDYGLTNGSTVELKDLGPQIGYATVFFWEYFGPLAIYLFFFLRPAFIYGDAVKTAPLHNIQKVAAAFWSAHYIKRILETFFVHRFSNATMPILNLFKNCSYYWFAGLVTGYFINHPLYTPPADIAVSLLGTSFVIKASTRVHVAAILFVVSELLNGVVHIQLRNLRPPGTKLRRIPRGILFALVSCPNYTFEILAWFFFNVVTQTLGGVVFMVIGALQMAIWAANKHRQYRRDFDGTDGREKYPRGRKAMVPFLF